MCSSAQTPSLQLYTRCDPLTDKMESQHDSKISQSALQNGEKCAHARRDLFPRRLISDRRSALGCYTDRSFRNAISTLSRIGANASKHCITSNNDLKMHGFESESLEWNAGQWLIGLGSFMRLLASCFKYTS